VKKIISFIATFALLFNSLAAPFAVLAQELPSPSSEPTPIADVVEGTVSTTVISDIDLTSVSGISGSISTDQADYSPTDVVLISGSGFSGDKTYTIEVTSNDDPAIDFIDSVTADTSGNISYAYQLDGNYRPNYSVQIKDGETVVASNAFTDAKAATSTTLAALTSPLTSGQTYSWSGSTSPASGLIPSGINVDLIFKSGPGTCPAGGTTLNTVQTVTGGVFSGGNFTAPAAGTYGFYASFAGNNNFANSSSSCQTITVNPAIVKTNPTVSVTNSPVTYTGSPQSATVTGSVAGTVTNVRYNGSLTTPTNVGTYAVTADFAPTDTTHYNNLTGASAGNFVINQATSTVTVNCPLTDQPYTGLAVTPCTASYSTSDGLGGALTPAYLNNIDVGLATANASYAGDSNHSGNSNSSTFGIGKSISTTTVTFESGPYVYRGTAFTANATVTGVGGLNEAVGILYTGDCTNVTSANGCTAHAIFAGDANHFGSNDTQSITIAPANASVHVDGYSGIYDGDAHGATGSATGIGSVDLSGYLGLGNQFTNVPGGIAHWTFDAGANYSTQSGNVSVEITRADADISVTEYSVTYDGDAHTATGTATGVKGENLTGLDLTHTIHTNAGDYSTDYWTFTDVTGNYNNVGHTVIDDKIAKADPTISVTPYSVNYDGFFHTATGSATGVKGEALVGLDLTGTTHKPAGDYLTDPWSFTDVTDNYNDKNNTVHDQIGKVTLTVTADNQTKQYSDPSDPLTFQYSGFVLGENSSNLTTEPTCTTTRTIGSQAGNYPITCSGGVADNYNFSYVNGNFAVTKENTAITYNGSIFASTAGPLITYAPISLSAHLTQEADGNLGDLSLAKVNFILTPSSGPVVTVSNIPVNSSGDALTTYNVLVGNYTVTAVINPTNLYWTTSQDGAGLLTIAPGSLSQTVTGGGWVPDSFSANGKDNFGFTVQYNKNSAPKGNFLYMWRGTDGYDYQLKSNSWANGGLSFNQTNGAYFTAKATLSKIDPVTGFIITSDGSYKFAVNITDGDLSSPKVSDTFAITIFDSVGNIWKQIGPSSLGGGNVVVHSK
jgi:hypothetical protein